MRAVYPSDITREQFEAISLILVSTCKVTHPWHYDIYDVSCAVQYVLRDSRSIIYSQLLCVNAHWWGFRIQHRIENTVKINLNVKKNKQNLQKVGV